MWYKLAFQVLVLSAPYAQIQTRKSLKRNLDQKHKKKTPMLLQSARKAHPPKNNQNPIPDPRVLFLLLLCLPKAHPRCQGGVPRCQNGLPGLSNDSFRYQKMTASALESQLSRKQWPENKHPRTSEPSHIAAERYRKKETKQQTHMPAADYCKASKPAATHNCQQGGRQQRRRLK